MDSFATLLEEFRKQKQISKTDLAREAGLTSGYISLLTRGDRTAPSRKIVGDLANALELDEEAKISFFAAAGYPDSLHSVEASLPSEGFVEGQEKHLTKSDWVKHPIHVFFMVVSKNKHS